MSKHLKKEYYDFVPSVVAAAERPPSHIARMVSWSLMVFCIIILTWSYVSERPIVTSAPGTVMPSSKIKTIQPASEGEIAAIFVKEGQVVKKGDVLITLDSTELLAEERQLKSRLTQLLLTTQRLKLESGEKIELGAGLKTQPKLVAAAKRQLQLNLESFEKDVGILKDEHNESERILSNLNQELRGLGDKEKGLQKMLAETKENVELGFVPRSDVGEIERELRELKSNKDQVQGKMREQRSRIDAAFKKIESAEKNRRAKMLEELTDTEYEYHSVEEELIKVEERLSQQTIIAPISGQVQQLTVNTVGGVVTRAEQLMEIFPEGDDLIVEARIRHSEVSNIEENQAVKVKFEAHESTRYGALDGEIEWIGSDAIFDEDMGQVFIAHVLLESTTLPNKVDGQVATIRSGLKVTVDIVVGYRKIIDFFLEPLRRYRDESLTER